MVWNWKLYKGGFKNSGSTEKKFVFSVRVLVECLANNNAPWEAYHAFTSGCLITLYKQPDVCTVGIGEKLEAHFR